ncbi:DUF6783 domain-containing protein [Blautia sp. AF19-1]
MSANWDSQLAKSLFQTRSRVYIMQKRGGTRVCPVKNRKYGKISW